MNTCANSKKDCVAVEVRYHNWNLVEQHMSNKSEDFDKESCIIDGDDLKKNSVNELQILYIQCGINVHQ